MSHLLDLLLWLDQIFSTTANSVEAIRRRLQRRWLLSSGSWLLCMALSLFLLPTQTDSPFVKLVEAATTTIADLFFLLGVICFCWALWSSYALCRFEIKMRDKPQPPTWRL